MGAPRDRVLFGGWTSRRAAETVAAFVDPFLAASAISHVFLVLKWDFLYFVYGTVIAAPTLVYAVIAFITACFTLHRSGYGMLAGVFVLYWLGSLLLVSARSDWLLQTSWITATTMILWIPNILLTVAICIFWAADLRRQREFRQPSLQLLRSSVLYLGLLVIVLLACLSEYLICSKADGDNESMNWLQCFAPLIASSSALLVLFISGTFSRLRRDRGLFQDSLKQRHEAERTRLCDLLEAVFTDHLSPVHRPLGADLLELLRSGMGSDITIIVEGRPIFLHSVVIRARRRVWDVLGDLESGLLQNETDSTPHTYKIIQKGVSFNQLFSAFSFLYSAQPLRESAFLAVQRLVLGRRVKPRLTTEVRLAKDVSSLLSSELGASLSDITWTPPHESKSKQPLHLHKVILSCRSLFFKALFKCAIVSFLAVAHIFPLP
jgi:hypothetical protein